MSVETTSLARALLRYNAQLLVLCLAIFAALCVGIGWLRFSSDNASFFGRDNPEFQLIRHLEDTYAGTSSVMIMVLPPEGEAFSPATLEAVRTITEDAWFVPYVLRVDSPTNYIHSHSEGEDIYVEALLEEGVPITPEAAARFAQIAPEAQNLRNRLIVPDGTAYGISIDIVMPDDVAGSREEVRNWLFENRSLWLQDYPGFEINMTGAVLGGLTLSQAARDDVITLVPLAFVVAIVILSYFLRSVLAVVTTTAVVGLGTMATFGIAGWLGVELTAGTAISPLAVMVLTAASCIHMILAWMRARNTGDADEATAHALSMNLAPITAATVTTAIGFLAMNFADSPPLQAMGNVVSLGLLFSMCLVFVVLPFGLRRGGAARHAHHLPLSRARMLLVSRWIGFTQMVWLVIFPIMLAVSVLGITRIGFDDNLLRYFSDRYEFRRDTDAVQARLTGLDTLQFSFTAPDGTSVFNPEFLRDIDRFSQWLRAQDSVVSTLDMTDVLKRMNRSISGDDPAAERIADTREENAQLMMFYELSLPVGLDLNTQIDVDRVQTRVVAFMRTTHSSDIRDLALQAEDWLALNTPDTMAEAGGYSLAFARITERNNRQMMVGLVLVLVMVSLILMALLRNVKYGAISLVPNVVPAIMAFGVWGVTYGDVNLGSTVVTSMTFGIVVDDTIHFLMHYRNRRKLGDDVGVAIDNTFETVGAAITITSCALIAGFAVMSMSGFAINQHMGALTAIVIAFALLADLLFLPSVLRLFDRDKQVPGA